MLDVHWLNILNGKSVSVEWIDGSEVLIGTVDLVGIDTASESRDNARLVAMSDAQLGAILSLLSDATHPHMWSMSYIKLGPGVSILGDNPRGLDQPPPFGQFSGVVNVSELPRELFGIVSNGINVFVSELQEQLMVDVRPELNAMVAAQNEMSDDLDAIRISLQEIAANIEAENNSERLEEIANTIGLLVALL